MASSQILDDTFGYEPFDPFLVVRLVAFYSIQPAQLKLLGLGLMWSNRKNGAQNRPSTKTNKNGILSKHGLASANVAAL
jgi:hypothetical protein